MSLALSTLIHEWRRYLAAVVALAFSGLLVLGTTGLFTGIAHSVLATTERTRADIFIMPYASPQLIDTGGNGLPERIRPMIYLNPDVVDVESMAGNGAPWVNVPGPGQKLVQTFVQTWAIDTAPNALTLPVDYPDATRVALSEPGGLAVDETDLKRLGVKLGDTVSLNGHTARLAAVLHNYQGVTQPSVIMSKETYRQIGLDRNSDGKSGPLMVKIRDPRRAAQVVAALNAVSNKAYVALTTAQLNKNDEAALLSEQIIGVMLGFSVVPGPADRHRHHLADAARRDPRQHQGIRQPARARRLHGVAARHRHGAAFWVGIVGLGATGAADLRASTMLAVRRRRADGLFRPSRPSSGWWSCCW